MAEWSVPKSALIPPTGFTKVEVVFEISVAFVVSGCGFPRQWAVRATLALKYFPSFLPFFFPFPDEKVIRASHAPELHNAVAPFARQQLTIFKYSDVSASAGICQPGGLPTGHPGLT